MTNKELIEIYSQCIPEGNPYSWHKCKDELPKPNMRVLAYMINGNMFYIGYYDEDSECWRTDLDDCWIIAPTDYWIELPQLSGLNSC